MTHNRTSQHGNQNVMTHNRTSRHINQNVMTHNNHNIESERNDTK